MNFTLSICIHITLLLRVSLRPHASLYVPFMSPWCPFSDAVRGTLRRTAVTHRRHLNKASNRFVQSDKRPINSLEGKKNISSPIKSTFTSRDKNFYPSFLKEIFRAKIFSPSFNPLHCIVNICIIQLHSKDS